jgi:hypothetical protein
VAWDGTIRPPEANEVGWKETLRMNPLEDVYVAVKAVHPVVPFGVPKSTRLLDPSQVVNSGLGFTNIDATTGNAPTTQTYLQGGVMTSVSVAAANPALGLVANTYSNQLTDFDNEYVWHCHILGHEENDFMRPFIFHPNVVVPDMPTMTSLPGATTLTWIDPTPYGGVDVDGVPTAGTNAAKNYVGPTSNPKNEIGFKVQESADGGATYTTKATVPANVTSWTGANPANLYKVLAYNSAGDSTGVVNVQAPPPAPPVAAGPTAAPTLTGPVGPTGLTQTLGTDVNGNPVVTLSWTAVPGATSYNVSYVETPVVGGVAQAPLAAVNVVVAGTLTSYTTAALTVGSTFTFSVSATTLSGTTAATSVTGGLTNSQTADPVAFIGAVGATTGTINLTWANNPSNKNNVAGLNLTWTGGPALGKTFPATSTGVTLIGLNSGASYSFTLQAVSNVATFNSATVALPAPVVAP